MPTMIAPSPYFAAAARSGTVYTADMQGVMAGVPLRDVPDMRAAGCELVGVVAQGLIGRLLAADMNVTTDQAIPLFVGLAVPYRVTKISVKNASVSLTTAAGGVYRAAAKAGTAMVASSQAYSGLTGATLALDLTLATATTVEAPGVLLYLSLTTAQGAAATADFYVYGDLYK